MVRSILAVVLGYAGMLIVTFATFGALRVSAPDVFTDANVFPPWPYVLVILGAAFLGGVVGGVIMRLVARRAPWKHGIALALVMLALWIVSWATNPVPQPAWYMIAVLGLGVLGLLLTVRARMGWIKELPRPE